MRKLIDQSEIKQDSSNWWIQINMQVQRMKYMGTSKNSIYKMRQVRESMLLFLAVL